MGLPIATNTTGDIYRSANAPPAAPDVAGVAIYLASDWRASHQAANVAASTVYRWTHFALLDVGVDLRDCYAGPAGSPTKIPGEEASPAGPADSIWIPDKNGTQFYVIFVERVGLGTESDHQRAYLQRGVPTWGADHGGF